MVKMLEYNSNCYMKRKYQREPYGKDYKDESEEKYVHGRTAKGCLTSACLIAMQCTEHTDETYQTISAQNTKTLHTDQKNMKQRKYILNGHICRYEREK